jgi:ABC-2 type transport system ATP-binding protein
MSKHLADPSIFTTAEHAIDTPAVVLSELTRTFDETVALDEVTLTVERGEVFGLLGPNGAGKTTTVRLVNGILLPTRGQVRTLGLDPYVDGDLVRRRTGVLGARPQLDERLSVREILDLFGAITGLAPLDVRRRTAELAELLELTGLLEAEARTLSTGMKQRVALARALLPGPELLLLDEATASIDPMAARTVRRLVRDLSEDRGRTVIVCTHNLVEAQELCDRVGILQEGRLLAIGTPRELAASVGAATSIEVRFDPLPAGVLDGALSEVQGLSDVELRPEGLDAVATDEATVPALVERLVRHGVRIRHVTERTPTLEDIYVALHDRGQP